MIEDHPVFDRTSRHKQSPVWLQLLVVLNRLGCDGNSASIQRTAMINGISYGSVKKFTERVFTAIRSLEAQYVYWPLNSMVDLLLRLSRWLMIDSTTNSCSLCWATVNGDVRSGS